MFTATRASGLLTVMWRARPVLIVTVVGAYLAGFTWGLWGTGSLSDGERAELGQYVRQVMSLRAERELSAQDVARQAVLDNGVVTVGLTFLLGLSLVGAPLILGILFWRGFIVGFTVGFLVEEWVLQGLILAATGVAPHQLIAGVAVLVAALSGLTLSSGLVGLLWGRRRLPVSRPVARHCLVCVGAGVLALLAAFVEAYVSPVLVATVARHLW